MIDIEFAVVGRVFDAFENAYPGGSCSSMPNSDKPPTFPHLNMMEADSYFYGPVLEAETVVFDVNVYSNKANGSKQECKAIMQLVDETMNGFGAWERVFCNQTLNADNRIYRMTARYRGVPVLESSEDGDLQYRIYRK